MAASEMTMVLTLAAELQVLIGVVALLSMLTLCSREKLKLQRCSVQQLLEVASSWIERRRGTLLTARAVITVTKR
jgi:hypothetical protein